MIGALATHLPIPATLSGSFSEMLVLCLLDYLVVIQGVAEVLFVGYVVVRGRPVFLSSSIDAGLGEIVIIVTMCGMNQTSPIVHV